LCKGRFLRGFATGGGWDVMERMLIGFRGIRAKPWKLLLMPAIVFGALLLVGARTAWAGSFLDFEVLAGASGSISYNGDSFPLVGSGIGVNDVVGVGTPQHTGMNLGISGGLLSFTSGPFLFSDPTTWHFDGGGDFTITGGIAGLGVPDDSTLLSGHFISAGVTKTTDFTYVSFGGIFDDKIQQLLDYYGVAELGSGGFNISFLLDDGVTPGDAFASSSIGSGNVINPVSVPEPSTPILLATALLPMTILLRKRAILRKKAVAAA
jgi:hypothetical protein